MRRVFNVRSGLLAAGLMACGGCAPILIGAGAVGGYAISKDSISNSFDLSSSHVYETSRQVMQQVGFITQADEQRGVIKGTVPGANVTITIKRLPSRTVQLKVKARNNVFLPQVDVAQSIYNQIVERL